MMMCISLYTCWQAFIVVVSHFSGYYFIKSSLKAFETFFTGNGTPVKTTRGGMSSSCHNTSHKITCSQACCLALPCVIRLLFTGTLGPGADFHATAEDVDISLALYL